MNKVPSLAGPLSPGSEADFVCLGCVSMAICLGAPVQREHPQGMAWEQNGLQGWAQGKAGAAGALGHGECGEGAEPWTPTSILYFNSASKLLLLSCAGGVYSPLPTPALSCVQLAMEELFQPVSPKIKEQTLLPAHDRDKPARQEHEDIGLATKTAEGVQHCHNSCLCNAKPGCKIRVCQEAKPSSRARFRGSRAPSSAAAVRKEPPAELHSGELPQSKGWCLV